MTRVRTSLHRGAIACVLAAVLNVVCAEEIPQVAATGPSDPCLVSLRSPKVLVTSATPIPDEFWTTKPRVTAHIQFRLDESGHPMDVSTTIDGVFGDSRDAFEQGVNSAFARFQFCRRGDFSTERRWKATLQYSPVPRSADADDIGMYFQSFLPAFVNFERFGHHAGGVVVRGTYAPDGAPRAVEIVKSGGDPIIDNKSLDAMATARILFRDGPPAGPIRMARSFSFRQ